MTRDLKLVRALLGGVGYYRKFLSVLSKRIRPITSLLGEGVKFEYTPAMEVIVREILAELAAPPIWSSPTGTLWPTAPAPSMGTATLASTVLALRLNGTARCSPSLTSAALPSILRGAGLRLTWELAACLGHQTPSKPPLGHEVSHLFGSQRARKHRQSGRSHARVQRWLDCLTAFDYILE